MPWAALAPTAPQGPERYAGSRLWRTDRDGALWYELSGTGVRRLDWRGGDSRPDPASAARPLRSASAPRLP